MSKAGNIRVRASTVTVRRLAFAIIVITLLLFTRGQNTSQALPSASNQAFSNATVTLVKSLYETGHTRQIVDWVLSVQHLSKSICILVDDGKYGSWLSAELQSSLTIELIHRIHIINVGREFTECDTEETPLSSCKENNLYHNGYKRMCRLWYSAVWWYLRDFAFVLRFDLDNTYHRGTWPTHIVKFGTVLCQEGDHPDYTIGLKEAVWGEDVSDQRQIYYPYTNVMFLNVQWVLRDKRLQDIFNAVEASNCICINRWGDLPLWGETLSKLGVNIDIMRDWVYSHGSHNVNVVGENSTC